MKLFALLGACALPLAACTTAQTGAVMSQPVPVAAVQDARTALASYQAALGLAQVALRDNKPLLVRVNALAAQAQPYVDKVEAGVDTAAAAPTLSALAAELLVEAAPYVVVVGK